jgi:hypothetical protein
MENITVENMIFFHIPLNEDVEDIIEMRAASMTDKTISYNYDDCWNSKKKSRVTRGINKGNGWFGTFEDAKDAFEAGDISEDCFLRIVILHA